MLHFRNIETGEIRNPEPNSDEVAQLKSERTEDGRFPLWEQTGAHDADPATHAADEEVTSRQRFADPAGLPLSDVTADGYGQSAAAVEKLGQTHTAAVEARHRGETPKSRGRSKTETAE